MHVSSRYRGDDSWGRQPQWLRSALEQFFKLALLTTEQGAATSIAAATDPAYESGLDGSAAGLYLSPYRTLRSWTIPFDVHGPFAGAQICEPNPAVRDQTACTALWDQLCNHEQLRHHLPAANVGVNHD